MVMTTQVQMPMTTVISTSWDGTAIRTNDIFRIEPDTALYFYKGHNVPAGSWFTVPPGTSTEFQGDLQIPGYMWLNCSNEQQLQCSVQSGLKPALLGRRNPIKIYLERINGWIRATCSNRYSTICSPDIDAMIKYAIDGNGTDYWPLPNIYNNFYIPPSNGTGLWVSNEPAPATEDTLRFEVG
jgi:hypothetical protein